MSLPRQMALLFAAVWLLALGGILAFTNWALHEAVAPDQQPRILIVMAVMWALLGAAAAVCGAWLWRRWSADLQRTVEQARLAAQGSFTQLSAPRAPELLPLARSVHAMTQRLSTLFDTSAVQLAELQRRAHRDAVTNLPNRRDFMGRLHATLGESQVHARGLLLLRLVGLTELNQRLGHDKVDRLLASLGEVLAVYPERVPDAITGRLNGADFALALPVAGITQETGESVLMALHTAAAAALGLPSTSAPVVEWVIGGVDARPGCGATEALAAADAALAEAEAAGAFSLVVHTMPEAKWVQAGPVGERAWRAAIARALQDKRVRLAQTAVCDVHGKLIHQRCELQLQLAEGGAYEPSRRWLGMASRSRLVLTLDLRAAALTIAACAADGQPRCLRVAAASLGAKGFGQELAGLLQHEPAAAAQLAIEIDERALTTTAALLPALFTMLRQRGVRLGFEHAGQVLRGEVLAGGTVLSHVTLRAHLLQGAASDHAVRDLARGMVHVVHGLGALALAECVDSPDDQAALWSVGMDGIAKPLDDAAIAR